jgi:hypothetical protein
VAEVDLPRRAEIRGEGDVQQPALAARLDRGHPGERRRNHTVPPDQPQLPRPFADQQPAIGQEGATPGPFQPAGEFDDAEGGLRCGGRRQQQGKGGEEMIQAVGTELNDAAAGNKSVADALRDAQAAAERIQK